MDNFITKQDILEYIDYELHPIISPDYYDVYCTLHDMVENCPDFEKESERKKGTWKPDESRNVYWICSACGFASEASGANILYHYCPNCGTDMRGGHE